MKQPRNESFARQGSKETFATLELRCPASEYFPNCRGRALATINRTKTALIALTLSCTLPALAAAQGTGTAGAAEPVSAGAIQISNWVTASGDNDGLPFIVIDKVTAVLFVFDAEGDLLGVTPALIGIARGDDRVPGIGGSYAVRDQPSKQRTTPAGRFAAQYGYACR